MTPDSSLAPDVVEELLGVSEASLPTNDLMHALTVKAVELMEIDIRLKQLQEETQDLEDRRNRLASRELPELMDQALIDRVGIPGMLSDVIMEPYYHANIKSDWPEEQRRAAFAKLEEFEAGHLIRTTVSVSFQRGEHDMAKALVEHIKRWNGLQGRPIKLDMGVPWATLTSFIKDAVLSGREGIFAALDTLGATVSRRCRVIERKMKSPKIRR